MIVDILKIAIKNGKLLLIWLLIVFLSSSTLSLSLENWLLSLVDSIPKEWIIKTWLILLLVATGLIFSLAILRKKQKSIIKSYINEINFQTCDWMPDSGVWKHKTTDVLFCQKCHSPLSSELYCAKCDRGFGKGECFVIPYD